MSILSLTKEIAIDLGTANTIIITDGQIAVEEPSVVAIRKSDDKMMIRGLIDLIPQRKTLFKPSIKMVVCVPSGATDADIVRNGIYLTGGGALLHGLAERLSQKMTIEFHVAEDPLHSVAKGTGVALKNWNKLSFLIHGSIG